MYEKLDKLRAEVERWRRKLEDVRGKLKEAEENKTFSLLDEQTYAIGKIEKEQKYILR